LIPDDSCAGEMVLNLTSNNFQNENKGQGDPGKFIVFKDDLQ